MVGKLYDVVIWITSDEKWMIGIYIKSASDVYPDAHWVQIDEQCHVDHILDYKIFNIGSLFDD